MMPSIYVVPKRLFYSSFQSFFRSPLMDTGPYLVDGKINATLIVNISVRPYNRALRRCDTLMSDPGTP